MLTQLLNSHITVCPARLITCKFALNGACVRFPFFAAQHYTDCAEKLIKELQVRNEKYSIKTDYAKDLEVKHGNP